MIEKNAANREYAVRFSINLDQIMGEELRNSIGGFLGSFDLIHFEVEASYQTFRL